MTRFLWRTVINALALFVVSALFPKLIFFSSDSAADFLIAGAALGLVNALLRPILLFLSLPLNILSFGLFSFVVNAVVLQLVAANTRLETAGFFAALLASVLLGVVSGLISSLLQDQQKASRAS